MAQASEASGSAGDATVRTSGDPMDEVRLHQYLSIVADEAEAAVDAVKETIEHLKASLEERMKIATEARRAADDSTETVGE